MDNDLITTDLSQYGYIELAEAGELLKAYADNGADFLGDGITLNFNSNSGIVFLSDENYNVAVLEDNKIVQFFTCHMCHFEGTESTAKEEGKSFEDNEGYCSENCVKENEGA